MIGLVFWMGAAKVQAGCGDYVLFSGAAPAKHDSSTGNPLKQKKCSGFFCTNSSPLAPVVPNLAPERLLEKTLLPSQLQNQLPQTLFVSFADECLVLISSGLPGDILDPPRS